MQSILRHIKTIQQVKGQDRCRRFTHDWKYMHYAPCSTVRRTGTGLILNFVSTVCGCHGSNGVLLSGIWLSPKVVSLLIFAIISYIIIISTYTYASFSYHKKLKEYPKCKLHKYCEVSRWGRCKLKFAQNVAVSKYSLFNYMLGTRVYRYGADVARYHVKLLGWHLVI